MFIARVFRNADKYLFFQMDQSFKINNGLVTYRGTLTAMIDFQLNVKPNNEFNSIYDVLGRPAGERKRVFRRGATFHDRIPMEKPRKYTNVATPSREFGSNLRFYQQ